MNSASMKTQGLTRSCRGTSINKPFASKVMESNMQKSLRKLLEDMVESILIVIVYHLRTQL